MTTTIIEAIDAEIAEHQSRIDDLEAAKTLIRGGADKLERLATSVAPAAPPSKPSRPKPAPPTVPCPAGCGRMFGTQRGANTHAGHAHAKPASDLPDGKPAVLVGGPTHRVYSCEHCEAEFTDGRMKDKHVRLAHPETQTDDPQ